MQNDNKTDYLKFLQHYGLSPEDAEGIATRVQHFVALEPYFWEEIKKRSAERPELKEITNRPEFLDFGDKDPKTWGEIYDAAERRYQEKLKQAKSRQIKTKPVKQEVRPIDKANSTVWNDLTSLLDKDGQLYLKAEKAGSKTERSILYSINFDELDKMGVSVTKELTPLDKDIYSTIASIMHYNETEIVSAGQIAAIVFNRSVPSPRDIKAVNDSITKMAATWILIDNSKEAGYKYPRFQYDGHLLPCERVSAYINGNFTDAAIHVFREPPLISFARGRSQITTVSTKLLYGAPISKTDQNRRLNDYLITRIARIKKSCGHTSSKMLYSTIFENCGINTSKQRERAPGKIIKYLDYYKEQGFIKGYKKLNDGVKIES